MKSDKLGIYIHIPFCIKKCNYCDFCSFPNKLDEITSYAEELCRRICDFSKKHGMRSVDTIYFGGGTPTLMNTECFFSIMSALRVSFDISCNAEITVECNPATIEKKGLAELRALGINRLSIGLQSADDDELRLLGRLHDWNGFLNTYNAARSVGFDNISVDLMYGIPNQTVESFKRTLEKVVLIQPDHISSYGLKIEKNTEFYKNFGAYVFPTEEEQAELYELCCEYLFSCGYRRYEISNFAKPGYESRHNLKYWLLDDYIGFGVAAHSCFEGERFGNSNDYNAFLNCKDICGERKTISQDEYINEYVMLNLRLESGISLSEFRNLAGLDFKIAYPCVEEFIKMGFMQEHSERVMFTTKGFLVSNTILSQMLDF